MMNIRKGDVIIITEDIPDFDIIKGQKFEVAVVEGGHGTYDYCLALKGEKDSFYRKIHANWLFTEEQIKLYTKPNCIEEVIMNGKG